MSDPNILEKVRKLLAKSEGTDNEAEANTFFSKAQELMEKYAIDEALARQTSPHKANFTIVQTRIVLPEDSIQVTRSKGGLLYAICHANRCTAYYEAATTNAYRVKIIVGTEDDIRFVNMLFHSILLQMDQALLRGFQSEMQNPTPPPKPTNPNEIDFLAEAATIDKDALRSFTRRSYRPEFIDAYCRRVAQRITEAARQRQDNNENTNSMALVVLRANKAAIDDYLNDQGVHLKPTRAIQRYNNNSYARSAGANAANNADLGTSKLSNTRANLNPGGN